MIHAKNLSMSQGHEAFHLVAIPWKELPGFNQKIPQTAWKSLERSCRHVLEGTPSLFHKTVEGEGWRTLCQKFLELTPKTSASLKNFLQNHMVVFQIYSGQETKGLLTGYFQPELLASRRRTQEFKFPIYRRPPSLVVIENIGRFNPKGEGVRIAGIPKGGTLVPYWTRAEIDAGALDDQGLEIAWVQDPFELYFMHVQGSGRLLFPDGSIMALGYDGTNGYPYISLGKLLLQKGMINPEDVSMETILAWLRDHPDQAFNLLHHNQSFVFFKEMPASDSPRGAQGTTLTPLASLAVDPAYIPLGSLVWIHAHDSQYSFQGLTVAQDVGGAIKGPLRGDFFCGTGDAAGQRAGRLKAATEFYLLQPKILND